MFEEVLKQDQTGALTKPVVPLVVKVAQTPAGAQVTSQLTKPIPPATKPTIAAQVNTAQGVIAQRPKTMVSGCTENVLDESYFRCVLYSETSARKTTTAARFAGGVGGTIVEQLKRAAPFTRIILSRPPDQLIPLDGLGFKYEYCPDQQSLNYCMRYPEQVWPEWVALPDPERRKTIIVDDVNQAISAILDAETSADNRKVYRDGLKEFENILYPLTRKNCNLIVVSLADIRESKFSGEEQIGPLMSPSFRAYVTATFAGVLYVQTKNWKLLTDRDRFTVMGVDDKGKEKPYTREVFGKVKSSMLKSDNPAFKVPKEVDLDLAALWNRIRGIK